METKTFNKAELQEFIDSSCFNELVNIPISRRRAISQIHNPRAEEGDILLVAAFDGNKTVGYLGIIPDFVIHENRKEKAGWLSCFWVDENYKSQNVAANLFLRAIRAWEQKIFITNIVPTLEPVYQKTKIFLPTLYKSGFRGYLRFNFAEILPPKKKLFQKTIPLLKGLDFSLNLLNNIRLSFCKKYSTDGIRYERLNQLDNSAIDFINQLKTRYLPQRGQEELEWMINYPWLTEENENSDSPRYYFSLAEKSFSSQLIKFVDDSNNIKAIILLNIRNKNLTVPYIFVKKEDVSIVSRYIINTMLELNLNMVTIFNDDLAESLKEIKTFYFTKTIQKPYFISKKLEYIKELYFQDGDGDCAFY
jgi:GNAT superfamily N-acetyltransferase